VRVVVGGREPDTWTQPQRDVFESAHVLAWLQNSAVVAMSDETWRQVRSALATTVQSESDGQSMLRLLDALQHVPMCSRVDIPPVDKFLDETLPDEGPSPLGLAAIDDDLRNILDERRSAQSQGKTRNSVYHRAIRPFASTALKVFLLDPYAANDISRRADGIWWLVSQLYADGIKEIEILSKRCDDYHQGVKTEEVDALWSAQDDPSVKLTLRVAEPTKALDAHDRHLRFKYKDGARHTPVVNIGRGASAFNPDRFSTPPQIQDEPDREAAEMRENVIRRCATKTSVIERPLPPQKSALRGPESLM